MTGLIMKDFLVMRKTLKGYALFLVLYALLAALGVFSLSVFTSTFQIIVMMLPISAFSYDELAKWDRFALALPLGQRAIVGARYLFTLLMSLGSTAFGLLACVILSLARRESLRENLAAVLICLTLGLFIADVMLPLCYKMGPERARPYLYLVVFLPMLFFFGSYKLGLFDQLDQSFRSAGMAAVFFILLSLAVLAGLGVSYLISCRVVKQKEY